MTRGIVFRALLATSLACAAAGSAQSAQPVEPADAQGVYEAARNAWNFTSYPRYANYVVRVAYRNGDAQVTRRYDTLEDLRRGIVFAQSFSREETANPGFPAHGVNIGILGMTTNTPQADDPIGPVALAVTYDFGISRASLTTQVAQLGSTITSPTRLQVIGRTGTTARTYDARLIEMLDDGQTYHLGLTPVRDPKRFRLREMWVSAKTFITQKILVAANFSRKPYTDVAWLVTFAQIDGGPYITHEDAQAPLDFGDGGTLDGVTISFEELKSTSLLPAYGSVGINGGPATFVTEP